MRVKSYKNKPKKNIVRSSWIIRCLNSDRLVPFRPEDLMVFTQSTKKEMDTNFDRYGNSLTEITAVEDVPSILQRVQDLVCYMSQRFEFIRVNKRIFQLIFRTIQPC